MLEEEEKKLKKFKPLWKIKLNKFMSNWIVSLTIVILTIFALFGDDIRLAFFPKEADEGFSVTMAIIMVIYTIEISLNAISEENYLFSFYFFLDIISTLTLLFDMVWIMDEIWDYPESDFEGMKTEEVSLIAKE